MCVRVCMCACVCVCVCVSHLSVDGVVTHDIDDGSQSSLEYNISSCLLIELDQRSQYPGRTAKS